MKKIISQAYLQLAILKSLGSRNLLGHINHTQEHSTIIISNTSIFGSD